MRILRGAYKWWVSLIFVAFLVQVAFAGYGAFSTADDVDGSTVNEDRFEDNFGPHAALGNLLVLATLLLLLLALAGRVGKRRTLQSLGLFALMIVQLLLAWFGASVPFLLGALHPLNALLLIGLSGYIARESWIEPAGELTRATA
jgi:Family of unknown function (DUF6220)